MDVGCKDRLGSTHVVGEEYLIKEVGAYLPGVYEEVCTICLQVGPLSECSLLLRCQGH